MSAGLARKYTDRDVREHPELVLAAEAFLRSYTGDFEFLVQLQREIVTYGLPLTLGAVRGTLNCMRVYPSLMMNLPEPGDYEPEPPVERPRRRLRVVKDEEPYRWPFELKTTWKKPVIISTQKVARVWHTVDPVRSSITYHPSDGRFVTCVRALCSFHGWEDSKRDRGMWALMLDEPPADRPACRTCTRLLAERSQSMP